MPRIVHIATTTISSETDDGYRLLEPGEVERFLRDHPESASEVPRLIEQTKVSLEWEKFLRDHPDDAHLLIEEFRASMKTMKTKFSLDDEGIPTLEDR